MTRVNHRDDHATDTAIAVLGWLAAEEERLLPFLSASGLAPGAIREAARDPGFLGAVLDHVMSDETTLVACAEALATRPERIAAAWRALQPPDFDHTL